MKFHLFHKWEHYDVCYAYRQAFRKRCTICGKDVFLCSRKCNIGYEQLDKQSSKDLTGVNEQ